MDDSQKQILIVEDEPDYTYFLKDLLTKENFSCDDVKDGKQALEMLKQKQYDLMILDVIMPGLNGIDTLEEIRKHPDQYKISNVLMLTNFTSKDTIEKAYPDHVKGYLLKSEIEPQQLVAKIKEIVSGGGYLQPFSNV